MTEQERAEAVAAVPVHERQVAASKARIDGAQRKVDKFEEHLKAARGSLREARVELTEEERQLDEVRKRADAVLTDGPVTIRGEQVHAYAGVASASAAGKGGDR